MNQNKLAFFTLLFATTVGCASSDPNANTGTAGAPSSAGAGGSVAGSGTAVGGAYTAGAPAGGAGAVGGAVATAGSAGSGVAGAAGGSSGGVGGSNAGSAGSSGSSTGSAGMGGAGGSGAAAVPSPGCQKKTPRPTDGKVEVASQSLHLFPTSYDGTKPFPLLIALHACGNPNTEFVNQTKGTAFETGYVRTFPNTPDSGQCWTNYSAGITRILAQYDDLMNNYCIDTSRVFAIAHSSGAQMLVKILANKADAQHLKLRAISPVAADPFNVAIPMPVLYIDGQKDNQRSPTSAADTLVKFRASNMCTTTSKPYAPVMACKSSEGPMVDPGCIIYDGCTVPTIWCSHNDPSYSGTEHGIPCFAIKSMIDFFATFQ